ncbi:septum formation initiator family protein [Patescibacteria group bacterium]
MLAKKTNKKKLETIIFSIVLIVLAISIVGFLVISNWKITQKRNNLNIKIESLKQEIQELEEKNSELKDGVNQTQSEEYLEQVAREQLNLKKPNEEVVAIQSATETVESTFEEKNFWQKFLEKIGL